MLTPPMLVNIAQALRNQAMARPQACALRESTDPQARCFTFAQLEALSDRAAAYFQAKGIKPAARVLVLLPPGVDLLVAVYGLFKHGAVPVVIDPGMGLKRWVRCVRQSQITVLLAVNRAHWLSRLVFWVFQGLEHRICVRKSLAWIPPGPATAPYPLYPAQEGAPTAILFTSGSTGPAKGVRYTHRQFWAQLEALGAYGFEPEQVDMSLLPVFLLFNPALGLQTLLAPLDPRAPAQLSPAQVAEALEKGGVSSSFGAPVLWEKIATYCRASGRTFPHLRRIICAGAPLSPSLVAQLKPLLPNGEVYSAYGATEALPLTLLSGSDLLAQGADPQALGRGTCVGRPLKGVEIRILPLQEGVLAAVGEGLPTGQVGEIWVCGPMVTEGYDGLPEATQWAKAWDRAGRLWHRMGDLGAFDSEGQIWLCGRKVEAVPTPQGLLYPDCCEAPFNTHPKVARCALIGLPLGGPYREPALVVQLRQGLSCSQKKELAQELCALAQDYPQSAPVRRFFFHPRLPTDVRHNAKIHRLQLARWAEKRTAICVD